MNPTQNLSDIISQIDSHLKSPLAQRDKFERELERKLGKIWREHRDELIRLIGDPPSLANVPQSFWDRADISVSKAMIPIFEEIFRQQAAAVIDQVGIGIDWALINESAADWALANTRHFLEGYNATNQKLISKYINKFYSDNWAFEDVVSHISAIVFDENRARMIAITETTRASVQSQLSTVNILEAKYPSLHFVPFWITANDEKVCPICSSRDGKEITDGEFPPIHVQCGCDVAYNLRVDKL